MTFLDAFLDVLPALTWLLIPLAVVAILVWAYVDTRPEGVTTSTPEVPVGGRARIKGEFFDGSPFQGEVPFQAKTDTRAILAESQGPGLNVAVVMNGVDLSFRECDSGCDGEDTQWTEVHVGDKSGDATLHAVFHFGAHHHEAKP